MKFVAGMFRARKPAAPSVEPHAPAPDLSDAAARLAAERDAAAHEAARRQRVADDIRAACLGPAGHWFPGESAPPGLMTPRSPPMAERSQRVARLLGRLSGR